MEFILKTVPFVGINCEPIVKWLQISTNDPIRLLDFRSSNHGQAESDIAG